MRKSKCLKFDENLMSQILTMKNPMTHEESLRPKTENLLKNHLFPFFLLPTTPAFFNALLTVFLPLNSVS